MKMLSRTLFEALSLTGLSLMLVTGCPRTPPPPIDPAKITAEIRPLGFQALPGGGGLLEFEYKVQNQNTQPIYLVNGDRMPYVTVADPATVELHFDVISVTDLVNIFDAPRLVKVEGPATYQVRFRVEHPFRPSDHFHTPGAPAATDTTVKLKVVQGYGETQFAFDAANSRIYQDFLSWQKTVKSKEVNITGL